MSVGFGKIATLTKGKLKMNEYSIPDLLVGQTYYPRSMARKYQYGEINFAEKRDDIYFADERYQAYAIRFNGHKWATVAVKVSD
jgi:hypothetical protein